VSRTILRPAALFLLICVLCGSLASAAPIRREDRAAQEAAGVAQHFQATVAELWGSFTGLFMNAGSWLDPSGNPSNALTDEGSSLDPHGKPAPNAGSSLDPHGGSNG